MYLSDFYDTVLEDHPTSIFVVRFEEETPYGKGYSNGIVYWDAEQDCPSIILEEPWTYEDEGSIQVVGYVDIQEINLATIAIISNSLKRRYDI